MNFDQDAESLDDLLGDWDEPDLTDKKWRFKARVSRLMNMHNLTRESAEEVVKTVIRTKEKE